MKPRGSVGRVRAGENAMENSLEYQKKCFGEVKMAAGGTAVAAGHVTV